MRRGVGRRCPPAIPIRGGGQVEEGGSIRSHLMGELLRVGFWNVHMLFWDAAGFADKFKSGMKSIWNRAFEAERAHGLDGGGERGLKRAPWF